ncbi:Proteasome subunit beta type-1 protein [Rutstroemia sp. NJR-2017a BVV2]|nr:Proteasome subunit beta type-1 protein [Rutstroemia sp. NJR-2017a BVV2]
MFRATPPAFFHQIPALLKFKLHQPLPLSPRESKQLLELLTVSFREQLDSEHGPSNVADAPSAHQVKATKTTIQPKPHTRPTDKHIESILTNPLFNVRRNAEATTAANPMCTFDRAVGTGMMTLKHAAACLRAERQRLASLHPVDLTQGLKNSGAGLKVVRWLNASGTSNDNSFLDEPLFAFNLFEFMQAEGLEDVFWVWIDRDIDGFLKSVVSRDVVARRISSLFGHKKIATRSFDDAVTILQRFATKIQNLDARKQRSLLFSPGQQLYDQLSHSHPIALSSVSLGAFEAFRRILRTIYLHDIEYCSLDIYHPTQPSADECLKRLRLPPTTLPVSGPRKAAYPQRIINISLTAAKILFEQERVDDARWIMEYLRTNYPEEVGLKQSSVEHRIQKAHEEESSIQLLESLSIA